MSSQTDARIMLTNSPDGDWPELCWVDVGVGDEDAARDYLAQFCVGEFSDSPPFRPVGPASCEWLLNTPASDDWEPCDPGTDEAVEFWKVVVD